MNIKEWNSNLRNYTPQQIIKWALDISERPIITTNFGPFSASLLHAVSAEKSDIKVIWVDTGYNTPNTYRYAESLVKNLGLNLQIYVPNQTKGFRDVVLGIPNHDQPEHELFTEQVKLGPFKRAMHDHRPDVWFTNLRQGQTEFRNGLDILSVNQEGVLKVSPFYYWTEREIDEYLHGHNLPNEFKYYDPTKQLENRECGLHT